MKKSVTILAAAVLVAVGAFFALPAFGAEGAKANGKIHDGVYADSIDLSGMTADQASKAIESYVDKMKSAQLTLNCASGNSVTVSASELGLHWGNEEIVQEAVELGKSGSLIRRFKDLSDLLFSETCLLGNLAQKCRHHQLHLAHYKQLIVTQKIIEQLVLGAFRGDIKLVVPHLVSNFDKQFMSFFCVHITPSLNNFITPPAIIPYWLLSQP